jgi:hypothetical protein
LRRKGIFPDPRSQTGLPRRGAARFRVAAQSRFSPGGAEWDEFGRENAGAERGAWLKSDDSTQPRALKMPLVGGERAGGRGEDLPEVFECLEERISLPAHRHGMLAG